MTTPIEPNKSKTIPLHIADQAVAACEAEIKKLREENAQLNYKLGRLLGSERDWTLVEPEHYARLKQKSACQAEGLDAYDKKLREAESMVERLRKAGDAMAFIMSYEKDEEFDGFVEAWNAAKDGKPSDR